MTYINNIAHIHNDIIRLAKENSYDPHDPRVDDRDYGSKPKRPAPPAPTAPSPPSTKPKGPVDPDKVMVADNQDQEGLLTASPPPTIDVAPVDPDAKSKAQAAGDSLKPPASTKPTAPPKDYKAELKSFTEDPANKPTGLAKAYSVFSKMKGTFGDVMNKYAENRLQSFLGGQDKKFRPSMRTRHPNPTEQYAQQYKELSGKPIFNRSQLNKDMKVLNSMRGEAGEHIKAWYKLQHLKTGRVPKLDQEMINQITLQLKEQNRAKRKTKPKKEDA